MNESLNKLFPGQVFPELKEAEEIAATNEYKRIPLCMEVLSDRYTPVEVVRIARKKAKHVFLLESASDSLEWGIYSFIGYEPSMEITCINNEVTISVLEGEDKTDTVTKKTLHPGDEIREILKKYKSPKIEGQPPFTGGLVGYFSYDYIKYAEPSIERRVKKGEGFRDLDLMAFDSLIAFDSGKQKIDLITGMDISRMGEKDFSIEEEYKKSVDKLKEMAALLAENEKGNFPELRLESELEPEFSKDEFENMVNKAKNYIKDGDIFQVVLSNPVTARANGSLFDTYRILRTQNPSPYMFYFSSDDVEIAGASPETLVKLKDGYVHTFPLAGTRPRGKTREEDERLEKELLSDEKERAEHNMLVDLGRNDLGRISIPRSVEVSKYMAIERFSQVMHIGSTVVGKLSPDKDAIDAIDSVLPAGTLSGAPKIRACEIIEELEDMKRGIYGGAIGYIDFTGNLDTCIGIRLVYKKDGRICVRSGAGIVYDSVPENEYRECINKARAVVKAIEASQGKESR